MRASVWTTKSPHEKYMVSPFRVELACGWKDFSATGCARGISNTGCVDASRAAVMAPKERKVLAPPLGGNPRGGCDHERRITPKEVFAHFGQR